MAHRFSNFAGAYNEMGGNWASAAAYQGTAYDYCDTAADYADDGEWKWGIKYCTYAIKLTLTAFDILFQNYLWAFDRSAFGECLYWAAQEGGDGALDMSMILDALWDANPVQCLLFIPMIDAMRGSIMEKTVTTDWMANALRHFL